MRFLIGQLIHETNTFVSGRTTESMFRLTEWSAGQELLDNHKGVRDYVGGMIDEAAEAGIEIVPLFGAAAAPSGIIARETYEMMKASILTELQDIDHYDAVLLALHGAGVAEGIEDMEGDLLQAVRQQIGSTPPLVVTLDLHANVTLQMANHADAIIGNRLYPHVDCYECGQEAVRMALRIVNGEVRPVMRLGKPLLLIPPIGTSVYPVSYLNEQCLLYEQMDGVVKCTFYHGFPYADIRDAGASILVITNGDESLADQIVADLSATTMRLAESFLLRYPSPEEALQIALTVKEKPVILNETSDNPGAGTPADGTRLLAAMLENQLSGACMAFIYDPETVEAASQAGVGSEVDVLLGAKTDRLHGSPLSLRAYVKSLTDGELITSSPMGKGTRMRYGKSVRLQVGGVDIIVCSYRNNQVFDEQIFLLHGIDVTQMDIVALKSSIHFRAAFEPLGGTIITVDSPGLSQMNFTEFSYKKVRRPIYPLDHLNVEVEER